DPGKAREILMGKLTEWREVYQQQKIAVSVEKMAERTAPSTQQPTAETIADKLEKLKKLLDTGAITKKEYEKAKKKLLK
ncbi:MAG: SHOCT domain-containing protein, partial [Nitrososphaeria archaeon]